MSVNEDRSRRNNRIELFEFKSLFLGNRSFIVLYTAKFAVSNFINAKQRASF
jgi:hypothetical protein